MGFKMKGFSGFRKQNSKSTFKSALPKIKSAPLKEDEFISSRNTMDNLPTTSKITDWDEWQNLKDKYDSKDDWRYTKDEWREIMYPHDDIYWDDRFTNPDRMMTNKIFDKDVFVQSTPPEDYKPEIDVDMQDVKVTGPRFLPYGGERGPGKDPVRENREALRNATYKERQDYYSWKRQLAKQGYRGADFDNSYLAFMRGDMPDPSLSRIGRIKKGSGAHFYEDYKHDPEHKFKGKRLKTRKKGKWKKDKKWRDTKVGGALSNIDLSQLGARTKETLDSIFGGV